MLSVRAHLVGWLVDDATDRSPDSVKGHSNNWVTLEVAGLMCQRFPILIYTQYTHHKIHQIAIEIAL